MATSFQKSTTLSRQMLSQSTKRFPNQKPGLQQLSSSPFELVNFSPSSKEQDSANLSQQGLIKLKRRLSFQKVKKQYLRQFHKKQSPTTSRNRLEKFLKSWTLMRQRNRRDTYDFGDGLSVNRERTASTSLSQAFDKVLTKEDIAQTGEQKKLAPLTSRMTLREQSSSLTVTQLDKLKVDKAVSYLEKLLSPTQQVRKKKRYFKEEDYMRASSKQLQQQIRDNVIQVSDSIHAKRAQSSQIRQKGNPRQGITFSKRTSIKDLLLGINADNEQVVYDEVDHFISKAYDEDHLNQHSFYYFNLMKDREQYFKEMKLIQQYQMAQAYNMQRTEQVLGQVVQNYVQNQQQMEFKKVKVEEGFTEKRKVTKPFTRRAQKPKLQIDWGSSKIYQLPKVNIKKTRVSNLPRETIQQLLITKEKMELEELQRKKEQLQRKLEQALERRNQKLINDQALITQRNMQRYGGTSASPKIRISSEKDQLSPRTLDQSIEDIDTI